MSGRKMLWADVLQCPYCMSDNCEVKQMGYFVNTLLLICYKCQRAANFRGPDLKAYDSRTVEKTADDRTKQL
jgi:hypothetical protein